jgi:hypothetical protein
VSFLKLYAIVITTNSGLWRYLIGDTVRFTFKSLPYSSDWQNETPHQCIWRRINGRKYRLAIAKACKMTHAEIDYTVAPVFMIDREKGAHEWMIEFKRLQNAFTLSKKY